MLRLGSLVLVVGVCAQAGTARADDTWTDPYPGIRHLERVTDKQKIHVITADLGRPTIHLRATRRADRGRTVSEFAAAYGCQIAVNGDFFKDAFATEGLAMGDGEVWAGSSDGTRWGFLAAGAHQEVSIVLPEIVGTPEAWMKQIVGGYPLLVDEGAAASSVECSSTFCNRNPRTAVGLSADGRTLFVVVVDGRKSTAVGMSLRELAALFIELGAARALNFDGGGSSAMFVQAEGGVQNIPSDGHERDVANHLGIVVDPEPDAGTPPPDAATADAGSVAPPQADASLVAEELTDEDIVSACAVGRRASPSPWGLILVGLMALRRVRPRRRDRRTPRG